MAQTAAMSIASMISSSRSRRRGRLGRPLAWASLLSVVIGLPAATAGARPPALQPGAPLGFTVGSELGVLGLRHFPDVGFDFRLGPLTTDTVASMDMYALPAFHAAVVLANSIVVGAHLELAYVHVNPDGPFAPDRNRGFIGIVPFFEYWLNGESFAPFVGAQFGPAITVADQNYTRVWLTAGGRGGLHFFLGNSFSIGPVGEFNFVYRSDNERAGWEFVLGISLRGWGSVGRSGEAEAATDEPAAAAEPTYEPDDATSSGTSASEAWEAGPEDGLD